MGLIARPWNDLAARAGRPRFSRGRGMAGFGRVGDSVYDASLAARLGDPGFLSGAFKAIRKFKPGRVVKALGSVAGAALPFLPIPGAGILSAGLKLAQKAAGPLLGGAASGLIGAGVENMLAPSLSPSTGTMLEAPTRSRAARGQESGRRKRRQVIDLTAVRHAGARLKRFVKAAHRAEQALPRHTVHVRAKGRR